MKPRILVIDDEESIRFTFERFMRNAGYEVETSASLMDGVNKISESVYDLVFADILLGGESGVDVLRSMRERNIATPLVFITGYPNLSTASEAVRLGAFDYLAKPVVKDALLSVTLRALKHKKALDEKESGRSNLEAIFRSVKDVILTVDKELMLLEFNTAAQDHYNLPRDAAGKPFEPLVDGCCGKCVEALRRVLTTQEPLEMRRLECRPDGGQSHILDLDVFPLLDSGGAFYGAVMVAREESCVVKQERERKKRRQFHGIVGGSGKMQRIYSLVESLADVQSSVLITGESGTGKELLAEAIHYQGKRKDKPLVKVNCSALSENLLESELFGHVRGAFTGAVKSKIGRFQLAHGGTIFLDEIGDISPAIQQRLLRVLQEQEFERVGDSHPVRVDVRVVAATNKDLQTRINHGDFREDLYYRLKVVEITLPPLRDRRDDIHLLVEHFIQHFNQKLNKAIEAVSENVMTILMQHPWPGNVRQLAHTLEHAFILCHQDILTVDHLPIDFRESAGPPAAIMVGKGRMSEPQAILEALEKATWNKVKAAHLLGISRRTLYRKLEEHGIVLEKPGQPCDMAH
jgi:two-component system, NtrC family, response regulator HydG